MSTKETIGRNIRRLRTKSNRSQEDFANEIYISAYYYGRIERGTANPTIDILERIANELKVKIADFLIEISEEGDGDV
ncbi:MAG: helix-turn-helix domain-containing protein [Firmicutes bacterium]|nr:helix-turn-helix domain-containing protein [Bacillota bacterium]